jgi:BirA family biotin operon repressor/biotin-[acetyl-CoA-carboxylase] ligase
MIKWPNDVVMGKRKVCGILTELHMNPDSTIRDVVIGVGINVNMDAFPEEIKEIAGSLLTETGIRIDRNLVVARIMERFESNYQSFQMGYDLSALRDRYEKRLINRGNRVRVLDPKDGFEGVALGITDLGELKVEADAADEGGEKEIRVIGAGEVSVRGLYSYV